MATKKKCTGRCGKTLSLDKFGWQVKKENRRQARCKKCRTKDAVEFARRNSEKSNLRTKEWKRKKRADPVYRENHNRKQRERLASDPAYRRAKMESSRRFRATVKGQLSSAVHRTRRRARKLEQLCLCCDPDEREQTYASGWLEEDCWICGAPADAMDHVIPLGAGKPGDALHCLDNFRSICKPCNGSGGKWYTLWPAHLGWDASPGWQDFLNARRTNN